MKIIDKIAFIVHEPVLFAHYSSTWAAMEKSAFVIILVGMSNRCSKKSLQIKAFVEKVECLGYEHKYLEDVLNEGVKYRYVVSNHVVGGVSKYPASFHLKCQIFLKKFINLIVKFVGANEKFRFLLLDPVQYIPLQVGIKQVRFMYGADLSDAWSLAEWNQIYDLFLCHGPNDESEFKRRFRGKTEIMGYPRYDEYFSQDLDLGHLYAEFDIDRSKKTILWMPTYDAFEDNVCSIKYFAVTISQLKESFNVIVRPHPLSLRNDLSAISLLESLGFNIDRDATRNMNYLYKLADFVMCDHGGSAFSALYLGKRLILLETPEKKMSKMVRNSSNLILEDYFPVIHSNDIDFLRALMSDDEYWEGCLEHAKVIRSKIFSGNFGDSTKKAVEILNKLDAII